MLGACQPAVKGKFLWDLIIRPTPVFGNSIPIKAWVGKDGDGPWRRVPCEKGRGECYD